MSIYHREFFTVIKKGADISNGVYPEHQQMSINKLFLWDNYNDLLFFPSEDFDRLSVILPHTAIINLLVKIAGSGYYIPYLKPTWKIKLNPKSPYFVE